MTGRTQAKALMRHIPEDELHAYLDQGLSRSQCVEIESHLAGCASCQAARDGIAALRDRTTALLARLAPPAVLPHPVRDAPPPCRHRGLCPPAARSSGGLGGQHRGRGGLGLDRQPPGRLGGATPTRLAVRSPAALTPAAVARQAVAKDSRTPATAASCAGPGPIRAQARASSRRPG